MHLRSTIGRKWTVDFRLHCAVEHEPPNTPHARPRRLSVSSTSILIAGALYKIRARSIALASVRETHARLEHLREFHRRQPRDGPRFSDTIAWFEAQLERILDRATWRVSSAIEHTHAANRRRFDGDGFQGRGTARDHRVCE